MSKLPNLKHLPQHVAIIMDGNGRWAKQRVLPRLAGHRQGVNTAQKILEMFIEYEIPYLTLYAFSTENWNRPKREIDGIFKILEERLEEGVKFAQENGIRIRHLGKPDGLPLRLQERLKRALELTQNNTRMTLSLAFNYGGRDEIIEAVRRLIADGISPPQINERVFQQYLYTVNIPDPDLIIRTGGEMRLSNFLIWQSAYAEIYFTPVLWPDFGKKEIDKALIAYSQRQRRFGSLPPD
ncbi:MAG: di-trans,poly-cis-decaprenylcistransferase [Chloroflexi bacterium RBG_19FT_COMBO_48_23]|nr:MAG: di-trans,poly-cis-decaprenylcistransferase [Chloroflexi bacterium RBG_19FT_COMBO_48_23]